MEGWGRTVKVENHTIEVKRGNRMGDGKTIIGKSFATNERSGTDERILLIPLLRGGKKKHLYTKNEGNML